MHVCCGSQWGACMLIINILDSLTAPCLVYNTATHTVYGWCGQYGQCMVHTLAGAAGVAGKGKGFPISIPSVGPGADPGVQAVSPQVTVSHPPGSRLPLLSSRPAVTSPAAERHRPLAGTKLYCLVTEAHRCEQLA